MRVNFMDSGKNPGATRQYIYAFVVAIALVSVVQARTNSIAPKWDAVFYMDMAKSGVIGNPRLMAPFAYRPAMPYLSRLSAFALHTSIENGFRVVGWISMVGFLLGVFALARRFAPGYLALVPMVALGFSFAHVKFPIFFYTLVDAPAYALIVLASWALISDRLTLCLLVSCLGLFFKEFLIIPLLLLWFRLGYIYRGTRSGRDLARLAAAIVLGLSVILLPRLLLHVTATVQYVDPLNDLSTLKRVVTPWFIEPRVFNVMYVSASYWLPTLLLLNAPRFDRVWAQLRASKLLGLAGGYLFLILLLTMYGGTNIFVFVAYSAPIQAIVLALLLQSKVSKVELVCVILITFMYNKIMLNIPLTPVGDYDGYSDFYGGWQSRVPESTLMRSLEMVGFLVLAAWVRVLVSRISNDEKAVV
jgi:hypothetical protein